MKLAQDYFEWVVPGDLKDGDVYLVPKSEGFLVCLGSTGADGVTKFAVLLGRINVETPDPIPAWVNLASLEASIVARCINPTIEPYPGVAALGLRLPAPQSLPGCIVLDGEGRTYLYVRQNGTARHFDLSGGPTKSHVHAAGAFDAWRVQASAKDKPALQLTHFPPS
ncbi:hypothetical protein [Phenylobacterium sp.]|uniref:hypothetical protein n=1 Tax=Phenylobacterium sp. TaxID=1871053 RepID=UPI003BA9B644